MVPINYGGRIESRGPETYRSQALLDTIFEATGLEAFEGSAVVVDLMSGPGGIALNLQKKAPRHSYAVLDNSQDQLDKIGKQENVRRILADVTDMSSKVEGESVDVATVRYGIKDIPKDDQPKVLKGINGILKPGGVFVLTDMISPEGMKEWINMQHSKKQQLGGRDIQKEGECHIPTEKEWLTMLKEAGFEAEVSGDVISAVKTTQWVTSNQIDNEARKKMDEFLLNSSPEIKAKFKIREENGVVNVEYPVLVIRAVKSGVKSGLAASGEVYVAR